MVENNLMLQSFLMKTMNEFPADIEWVATADFEERYQVSFYGEVKSISRIKIRKNGRPITVKGKALSTYINKNGYVMVELHDMNGDNHPKLIHKLVWESFYGKIPDGLEVEHWDDDPTNNVLTNLYLCTHPTNCQKVHFRTKRREAMVGNTLSKGVISPGRIPIVCLDLYYNIVKIYDYISQVAEDKFAPSNVSKACKGVYEKSEHKYRNHLWYYLSDYEKRLGLIS